MTLFDVYDALLVPLLFESYADDMVARLGDLRAGSVLETAAGTGAVTRSIARSLPAEVSLTATDLVQGMIDRAIHVGTPRPVRWERADVLSLPFEEESFDVVVCQFGAMFFHPKAAAFAEMRRVLRPHGRLLFSVWDGLDRNEFAAAVNEAVAGIFPDDPPQFITRTPYAYHDVDTILGDLHTGGFDQAPSVERVEHVSRADAPSTVAAAFCAGTPLRDEIETRRPEGLADVTARVADALERRFGPSGLEGRISAQFVEATKGSS